MAKSLFLCSVFLCSQVITVVALKQYSKVHHLFADPLIDQSQTKGIVVLLHVLGQGVEAGALLLQDGHGCWCSPGTGPM